MKTLKLNLTKLVTKNKGILTVLGGALLLFIAGFQLADIGILRILILVIVTYLVDFFLSKTIGNLLATFVNVFIILILVPPLFSPVAFLLVVGIIGYFTYRGGIFDFLGIGQIIVFGYWAVAKLLF